VFIELFHVQVVGSIGTTKQRMLARHVCPVHLLDLPLTTYVKYILLFCLFIHLSWDLLDVTLAWIISNRIILTML
jgi:hypothetical protein